jgi:hypothetical protein
VDFPTYLIFWNATKHFGERARTVPKWHSMSNSIFVDDKLSLTKTCQNVTFFGETLTVWQF